MYKIFVNLAIESPSTGNFNYKELYDCKWDPMTLKKNILYKRAFNFL